MKGSRYGILCGSVVSESILLRFQTAGVLSFDLLEFLTALYQDVGESNREVAINTKHCRLSRYRIVINQMFRFNLKSSLCNGLCFTPFAAYSIPGIVGSDAKCQNSGTGQDRSDETGRSEADRVDNRKSFRGKLLWEFTAVIKLNKVGWSESRWRVLISSWKGSGKGNRANPPQTVFRLQTTTFAQDW